MNPKIIQVLKKLEEISSNNNPHWNVPPETGALLNTLAKYANAQLILEIGTSNGYSGIWFAEAMQQTGGKLVTVESNKERFLQAQQNFAEAELSEYIEQIQGHAPEAVTDYNGVFDLMFFDATKNEHLSYFETLEPKLKKNGLIITDNTSSHADSLNEYIEKMYSNTNFQNTRLEIGTGLLISLKLS